MRNVPRRAQPTPTPTPHPAPPPPRSPRAGYGIPYASALLGDGDEPLVTACLHALLALLDYSPPAAPPAAAGADGGDGAGEPEAPFNIYRSMLAGLADPLDCDILFGGITRLLANVPQVRAARGARRARAQAGAPSGAGACFVLD